MNDMNKEDENNRAEETAERWLTYIVGVSAAASFVSALTACIFVIFASWTAALGFAGISLVFFGAFLVAGNAKS